MERKPHLHDPRCLLASRRVKRERGAEEHGMAGRKKGTVGIVGLGIMGGAFARNLMKSGWRVVGYDVDAGRNRVLAKAGVEIAANVAALAAQAPTIITSLPSPRALDAVVAQIAGVKLPSKTVIEASTFTLEDKQRAQRALKKAGHVALDCPVSGTGSQAAVGDLVIYASGEAMVLGIKAGLEPQRIFDLVRSGAGNSRVFELRAPMMVKDKYDDATMKIKVWQKDMDVIGEFATALGVPTPLFSATIPLYASAMSTGHAMHDTAAVCAVLEKMAGVKRTRKKKR